MNKLIDKLNKFPPTIKSTCDYSRERLHFLDAQVILENNEISTDLFVKKRKVISTSTHRRVTHTIVLSRFLIVEPCNSTEYVRLISYMTTVVTS